jgi:hypothetical protein
VSFDALILLHHLGGGKTYGGGVFGLRGHEVSR